ncbi:MAG: hypothetical protein A2167_02875 [Planctomycetes bacterium RBG_13_46_10]|nr:MAG: hypothetical protein A2167_02875 [Planctomycetes bacterium RBG_13_46_10]
MRNEKNRDNRTFTLIMLLSFIFVTMFGTLSMASQGKNIQHYKLLSILEYSGENQFKSEFEINCTIKRFALSDDKIQYVISTNNQTEAASSQKAGEQCSLNDLSFIVDNKTRILSTTDTGLAFLEKVANECSKTLTAVTRDNIAKTWQQRFNFSSIDNSLPRQLRFTLTAIPVQTETLGELIAVRALSEPFAVVNGAGPVPCRANCVYVFDRELKEIYLGISVFKAATNIRGFKEVLQHSVATRKADEEGNPIDLSTLGTNKNFENLVSKVGVTSTLNVVQNGPLPQWAAEDAVKAAQVANISAATSCEGTLDPTITCLPISRIVELQSSNNLKTTGAPLASGGQKGMFDWFGWNWTTAGVVTGATLGTIAIGGGFSSDSSHHRSPTTPD